MLKNVLFFSECKNTQKADLVRKTNIPDFFVQKMEMSFCSQKKTQKNDLIKNTSNLDSFSERTLFIAIDRYVNREKVLKNERK